MFLFHSTEVLITINLAIIATGLSLTQVGSINIILVNTPKQSNGVSLGMTTLLYLIGTSIGPVLAGLFMQANQIHLPLIGSFPSPQSYNLIYLTAALMSVLSVILVGTIAGRRTKPEIIKK